jgi:hypothetical protein
MQELGVVNCKDNASRGIETAVFPSICDNVNAVHGGRLGFDVGYKAAQGMPRSSYLVNPLEILHTPTTSVIL